MLSLKLKKYAARIYFGTRETPGGQRRAEISEIWLTESTGQMIQHEILFNKNAYTLNLENFSRGFNFLSIKSQEGIVKIFKIIKQ
jgi:hypothetical protein